MRIVFMGTPAFAVPSLQILHEHGYEIAGVITATDKRGGRGGKQLLESEVKKYAVAQGLTVLQPANLKSTAFQRSLQALQADLQVVVAFRMLPKAVWDMPPIGTMNLHASLLPKYRGAAPINWAIIRGEKQTGLTTFFLQHAIDTGDILQQKTLSIQPFENAGSLHDRMMQSGAELVLSSVQAIERGDFVLQPQDKSEVSHAPKIFREDCAIDFSQSVHSVHNFIRGLSPYPAAWTQWQEQIVKLYEVRPIRASLQHQAGHWYVSNGELRIAAANGYLIVHQLQPAGKRRMSASDYLNGYWKK